MHLLTIPPGGKAQAHLHENHETTIYVIKGEAVMWYGDNLSQKLHTKAGDFVYILPVSPTCQRISAIVMSQPLSPVPTPMSKKASSCYRNLSSLCRYNTIAVYQSRVKAAIGRICKNTPGCVAISAALLSGHEQAGACKTMPKFPRAMRVSSSHLLRQVMIRVVQDCVRR
jgi:hypothetical protein